LMTTSKSDTDSPSRLYASALAPVTQRVVVTKGQEAQVTMMLDLSKKNREEK